MGHHPIKAFFNKKKSIEGFFNWSGGKAKDALRFLVSRIDCARRHRSSSSRAWCPRGDCRRSHVGTDCLSLDSALASPQVLPPAVSLRFFPGVRFSIHRVTLLSRLRGGHRFLVEMHDGAIDVRSDGLGKVSEFVVRLPLALLLAGDGPAQQIARIDAATRHRILIVDDNVDAAESLAMFLAMMGNETLTAHDGLAALELASSFSPDVIFLDIGMPKLSGYEVSRRIRQEAWGTNIVLIALTGWGQEEDKRQSKEAGFDFHLTKPVIPEDLEKQLDQMTAAKASGRLSD